MLMLPPAKELVPGSGLIIEAACTKTIICSPGPWNRSHSPPPHARCSSKNKVDACGFSDKLKGPVVRSTQLYPRAVFYVSRMTTDDQDTKTVSNFSRARQEHWAHHSLKSMTRLLDRSTALVRQEGSAGYCI